MPISLGKSYGITNTRDPLKTWALYSGVMAALIGGMLYKAIYTGLTSDTSRISIGIFAMFAAALVVSFLEARRLRKEWAGINRLAADRVGVEADADAGADASQAEQLAALILKHEHRAQLNIKDLIDSYYSILETPLRFLGAVSGLLVTLGLIGTILGLIISVGGLEGIMKNVGMGNEGMVDGVRETIRGMAVAFYSTLFGSILGAVVLRLLVASLNTTLTKLSCGLFAYLELNVRLAALRAPSAAVAGSDPELAESARAMVLHQRSLAMGAASLTRAMQDAENVLKAFTATTLDSRLALIAQELNGVVQSLRETRDLRKNA